MKTVFIFFFGVVLFFQSKVFAADNLLFDEIRDELIKHNQLPAYSSRVAERFVRMRDLGRCNYDYWKKAKDVAVEIIPYNAISGRLVHNFADRVIENENPTEILNLYEQALKESRGVNNMNRHLFAEKVAFMKNGKEYLEQYKKAFKEAQDAELWGEKVTLGQTELADYAEAVADAQRVSSGVVSYEKKNCASAPSATSTRKPSATQPSKAGRVN